MASISKGPNGTRIIQFVGGDGKRRSIRLGKMPAKMAEAIKVKLEALNAATISKCPLDNETAAWVAGIGDDLAAKLAAVGLTPDRASAKLGEFLDGWIAGRGDTKKLTQRNYRIFAGRILRFFDRGRDLRDITPADADAFLVWLREIHAESTAGRTVRQVKQFFRAAVRARLIRENPFADLKQSSDPSEANKCFVSRETITEVLAACPDSEWRLIVALSRYGGLRCPSEHLALEWPDVDWARGRFLVNSPKTGPRWVPLFPELRPYLEEAFELAAEGAVKIITSKNSMEQNLRTRFGKIIRRAGVAPWPKPFHNLRASRETELVAEFPLHVVCAWLGHSALVAQKHYLQVTDADFERAAGGGAKSGAVAVQKAVQCAAAASGTVSQPAAEASGVASVPETVRDDASSCGEGGYAWQDSNLQPLVP